MKKATKNPCFCDACQRYYSISTLAERWDFSRKTIIRMISSGKLNVKRIGGSVRIPHSELLKVIEDI